jgi:hypothetical protein
MHIYLRHPTHGTKVAVAESEALYDEKNGWVRYTVETPVAPVEVEVPDVPNFLAQRRRGRPPKVLEG